MELASPLYSYFLIFVELGNLQMELARPAVLSVFFRFSYISGGRQSSNGASWVRCILIFLFLWR